MKKVAALYLDDRDQSLWNDALSEINNLVAVAVNGDLASALEAVREGAVTYSVIMLSARLYPEAYPGLVVRLRALFPEAEFLVISDDKGAPPLKPLFTDRIRHLTINPERKTPRREQLSAAVTMLAQRRAWDILSCLLPGTPVHSYELGSSDEKELVIGELERALPGDSEELELLRQKAALLADELLENAMYNAPRGSRGTPIFHKGEQRQMLPHEQIVFSFGFDGETLALSLTDSWGSLEPDQVLEYLARNEEGDHEADACGGRGLFIVWRFLDQLHVSIQPGRRTTVGGQLHLASGLDPEAPRGFHIIKEEIAA